MSHRIDTEIEIDAPPSAVWRILVDLPAYPEWNPFITFATGTPEVGERLTLRLEPSGGRSMAFRPSITRFEAGEVLEWLGRLGVPGLFDGRHRIEVQARGDGTRLVHGEQFSGILVPLMRRSLDSRFRPGFEAMNAALKARTERMTEATE